MTITKAACVTRCKDLTTHGSSTPVFADTPFLCWFMKTMAAARVCSGLDCDTNARVEGRDKCAGGTACRVDFGM